MNDGASRRSVLATIAASSAIAGCLDGDVDTRAWEMDETLDVTGVVQYNAPDCDCCDEYAAYLQDHLDDDLAVEVTDDLESVKRDLGVPSELDSCHTVDMGGYAVEGHVPVEVVSTLLAERPDADGIALPDMPAGSPGMPGTKDGEWVVYAFADGTHEPYRTL